MEKLINDFSFGLFFWQMLLFVLLLFLLKKFAWKPILDALNSREEGIKNALEEADKARQEMMNLQANNEKILKEAVDPAAGYQPFRVSLDCDPGSNA